MRTTLHATRSRRIVPAGALGLLAALAGSLPLAPVAARAQDAVAPATAAAAPTGAPGGLMSSSSPSIYAGDTLNSVPPSSVIYDGGSGAVSPSYVLGPGDGVSVRVAPQEKYSGGSMSVGQDGAVDYPQIGRVQAAGLTVEQLADVIKQRLSEYCVAPDVTVTLTALRPQVVYVTGGVPAQRVLDAHAASTLARAITLAGGASDRNELANIVVLRGPDVLRANLYPLLIQGKDNGDNIPLKPGDMVIVPTNTARITVLGAVNNPGLQPLEDTATTAEGAERLSEALSRAGGTERRGGARIGAIEIMRGSAPGVKPTITKYDYGKFIKSANLADNPVLQDNDIIYVPDESHPNPIGTLMSYTPFYWFLQGIAH